MLTVQYIQGKNTSNKRYQITQRKNNGLGERMERKTTFSIFLSEKREQSTEKKRKI